MGRKITLWREEYTDANHTQSKRYVTPNATSCFALSWLEYRYARPRAKVWFHRGQSVQ